MDTACNQKLDGRITEQFWQRKQADREPEEFRLTAVMSQLEIEKPANRVLTLQRTLELAEKAYFLYLTRKPAEQADLLKNVLLNCSIDAVSLYPTYRKPFDLIFKRAKFEEWSGRRDSNF
jgi:hypothetical protein